MKNNVKSIGTSAGVMILAAGMGKRMRSSLPKVLHEIGGESLLFLVLKQVQEAGSQLGQKLPIAVVVGHGREKVEEAVRSNPACSEMNITFIHQAEQRGTGHAARCVMDSEWGAKMLEKKTPILVLPGDLPLIPSALLQQMIAPLRKGEVMRLLTCDLPDPTGYGRVVRRGKQGSVLRIVEERDANIREKTIKEVAASIYTFQSTFLKYGLSRLSDKNAQGELYLTDLIAQAARSSKKIDVLKWQNSDDLRGVNDPWELALAGRILNERCVRGWALKGVKFMDPLGTWIDTSVALKEDVVIHPGAILRGKTSVRKGTIIGPHVTLTDVTIGSGAHIKAGTVAEDSVIDDHAQVGPYAHLRPESRVGEGAKIGNFVELKKTSIGPHTNVAHLSYLGDAEVGRNVNIGCGFITCNFDGRVIDGQRKHKSIIEDDVFMGSDCQVVAPIRIGKGSYVASGSTVTESVEPGALAIARSRQVTKPGYAEKLRAVPPPKK